jgi:hypothetical protein
MWLPGTAKASALVRASVDARVEFLAALARTAGFEEYSTAAFPAWTEPFDEAFRACVRSPAVQALRQGRVRLGLGFDALPSLALHLDGEPGTLAMAAALSPWPAHLDARWQGLELGRFVAAANRAARAAGFHALWSSLARLRSECEDEAQAKADSLDLPWFEAWFGFPALGTTTVVPSPLSGRHNYGVRRGGRSPATFAILGVVPDAQSGAISTAGESILAHEVAHSFVNPVLAENQRFLHRPGSQLFAAVRERMEGLHYGTWEITINESVVRAVGVRYLLAHGGASAARSENARQITEGFPWTLVLAEALGEYENNRDRFPTFGDFSAQLAAVIDVIAAEETARAANRPRVVSVAPDLAEPVDPASPALVVTFSHRMQPGTWSIVGEPADTPGSGPPSFDASGTVFTLPWRLERGRGYHFSLNDQRHQNFRSEAGVPLEPVALSFTVQR